MIEEFESISLAHLISAASIFTPEGEREGWVATKKGSWAIGESMCELFRNGEVVDSIPTDEMRQCASDQLSYYRITPSRINRVHA